MTVPIIIFSVFIIYGLLIFAVTIWWLRLKLFKKTDLLQEVKVSVIVAVRNESENIVNLLNSLLLQDYPADLFEIIIVDDHSTDATPGLVEDFIAAQSTDITIKLITLSDQKVSGKKAAINTGIQSSMGELILITDADCTMNGSWISTIASYFSLHKPKMILGPVRMTDGNHFFGKLQALEFMSLISAAAGSCNAGFPLMANGANIAFTRQAFDECGGYTGNIQFQSGDDMFMMMSIKKKFGPQAIRFLRSADAFVNTPSSSGVKSFVQQRMRWVSKSRGYTDRKLIASSILVYLTNLCLVLTLFAAIINPIFRELFLISYILKMAIDFPLMLSFSRFQRNSSLLWLFPLMEVLNAVYTTIIGIAGNTGKYEWKGRRS